MNIFLSAPYTAMINNETMLIDESYKAWLSTIIMLIKKNEGVNVISAHVREKWGAQLFSPEVAIIHDFKSIDDADAVFAFIGDPPSPGVLLEVGYALAKKKRMVIFSNAGQETLPYLVNGISVFDKTSIIKYSSFDELTLFISKELTQNA